MDYFTLISLERIVQFQVANGIILRVLTDI